MLKNVKTLAKARNTLYAHVKDYKNVTWTRTVTLASGKTANCFLKINKADKFFVKLLVAPNIKSVPRLTRLGHLTMREGWPCWQGDGWDNDWTQFLHNYTVDFQSSVCWSAVVKTQCYVLHKFYCPPVCCSKFYCPLATFTASCIQVLKTTHRWLSMSECFQKTT